MEKINNNLLSSSHLINDEELRCTPITHRSSSHLINPTTVSKKGNDFNYKVSLNSILSDLTSLSSELTRVQKAKINSSIESLKVIISRIPDDFQVTKEKDLKVKDNSFLNSTNNNNWLNLTQNKETMSQSSIPLPFNSLTLSNGINRLSKQHNSGTIFFKNKSQVERRKSVLGEIKKAKKTYDDLDNSCNEESKNQLELEKKMNELSELRVANKIITETNERLELETKITNDKNQEYKSRYKKMEIALKCLNKEYDELTVRFARLQLDYEELSNQKHLLHNANENLKFQSYRNDILQIKKLKSNEEVEQLLRQSREEFNSVIRRESELMRDLEAKNKLNSTLLAKLKNKEMRLNQIREINKKLEMALCALVAKKEYFDSAVIKINEATKSYYDIGNINTKLENENSQLKKKVQELTSQYEKLQKQIKENMKSSSSAGNLDFSGPSRRISKFEKLTGDEQASSRKSESKPK